MTRAAIRGGLTRVLFAICLLWAALPWAAAEVAVPPLKARVTDLSATLSQDQRATLEQKLAALEARKGSQIAVLLVPTVQPETVEQYAIRVFDQWKLGRKGVDDGVLLLIAKNDRKLRIEVGRGLEGAIPDAYAKRIIDEEITPRFKQGDFYGGITAGADRIVKLVDGEPMPPPAKRSSPPSGSGWSGDAILYGFFIVLAIVSMLQSVLGRLLGSGIAGVAAGAIVYLLAGSGIALFAGAVVFVISLLLGGSSRGGGWSSGGGGSSWSSGGSSWSSGGGGFSGGGGSSGGGGASGSW